MLLDVLNRTPGLFFTLLLISFTFGTLMYSIIDAKNANAASSPPPSSKTA